MLQVLDAAAVRRWCSAGREGLAVARDEIDDLNVYPVPDGDTGTNLLLTMESVEAAVTAAASDMTATARAMASGALLGARGNSGVILSQLLRGLAEVLEAAETCTSAHVQQALTRAAELCYSAVATPVEGTVLTVLRESAEAAASLGATDLASVVREARAAAARSLARTPDLLPALRAAGVVDAGGRGLCVLLEALERVVTGERQDSPGPPAALVPRDRSALTAARETGSEEFAYEVQLLLHGAGEEAVERLRDALGRLGDSLVVVGGGPGAPGLHNVHVHVNDVGAAIEAAIEAGRPSRIAVTRFADQLGADQARADRTGGFLGTVGPAGTDGEVSDAALHGTGAPAAALLGRAVVAVSPGAGLAALFEASGAVVVQGGPAARPSTGDLLAAVIGSAAAEVVLLPNDPDTATVARAAAEQARAEGRTVAVVPTRSVVQGLAALAVADETRSFADDVASMADAAGSTRAGEVTTAVREAVTMAGICRPGDVLGLLDGDVALIGSDVEQVAQELLSRLLTGGGELVTVVTGADAPGAAGERLTEWVEKAHPVVEVVTYDGGQPLYPFLLGVE